MTDTLPTLHKDAVAPEGPSAAAALLEAALAEMLGAAAIPVSLTLDYGPTLAAEEAVRLEAHVDRQTRTLAFAHARIIRTHDGAVAAAASAVFRRAPSI